MTNTNFGANPHKIPPISAMILKDNFDKSKNGAYPFILPSLFLN